MNFCEIRKVCNTFIVSFLDNSNNDIGPCPPSSLLCDVFFNKKQGTDNERYNVLGNFTHVYEVMNSGYVHRFIAKQFFDFFFVFWDVCFKVSAFYVDNGCRGDSFNVFKHYVIP